MFNSRTVATLLDELSRIESQLPGPANRNPRSGFKATIKFLERYRSSSVDGLANSLAAAKKAASARKPRKTQPLRSDLVARHTQALKAAGTNSDQFSIALNAVRSDGKVRLLELKSIVREYTGDTSSFSKKDVGFGMIEQVFDQRWKLAHR